MGRTVWKPKASHAWLAIAVGVVATGVVWANWDGTFRRIWVGAGSSTQMRDQSAIKESDKSVSLILSGDTDGWIVPCGCTANQSGGLLRRASFVARRRKNAEVVVADAGGAPSAASDYDRCKFEFILDGETLMGSAAHNLGGPELGLGVAIIYLTHHGPTDRIRVSNEHLRKVVRWTPRKA